MTSAAVMQPTYLPWLGYFDLVDRVDRFVLLDTVDFSYRSWQHRNRIRTAADELQFLTIPVPRAHRRGTPITDVGIAEPFATSHLRSIELAYGAAARASSLGQDLERWLTEGEAAGRLGAVTIPVVRGIAESLGIGTPIDTASALGVAAPRSEGLVRLCQAVGATTYVTPPGSVEYLLEDAALFEEAGIEVVVQGFEHPTYPQRFGPFLPYAAAIDAVFCTSPEDTLALVRGGRRPTTTLEARDGT